MANLSVKLELLPGITRNINITLEELHASFNTQWTLEDRVKLLLGLKLEAKDSTNAIKAVASIFANMDIGSLTVDQLMILDSTFKDFQKKIDAKKSEFINNDGK